MASRNAKEFSNYSTQDLLERCSKAYTDNSLDKVCSFLLILLVTFLLKLIVHYATSAIKRFLTSVSLQHEPKASDVITLVKTTFFARVSYEILYHEV